MVTIQVNKDLIVQQKGECKVLFIDEEHCTSHPAIQALKKVFPDVVELLKKRDFTAKALTTIHFPVVSDADFEHYILVGLGSTKEKPIDIEVLRRAVGKAIRIAEQHRFTSIILELPSVNLFDVSLKYLAEQVAITIQMALYHFNKFITDKKRLPTLKEVTLAITDHDEKQVKKGIEEGSIIGDGVQLARHWIDLPPVELTPIELATVAKKIAKEADLKYTVFDEKEITEMGMGGLAAVSKGSDRDAELVILEYHCGKKDAPTLAFVGKGVTFDSGGLSIKPAQYMETMKEDMSGAAAVIAAMKVIGQLKPDVNVIGLAPIAENLPSGKATKPGDIITFYNGKTAEVKNTDAEGRLILADALSYAEKHYKLDAMVDIATLTGSCAYALGPFFTGLMSNDEQLVKRIEKAGRQSGDHVWRLPLTDDYKKAIKSPLADMSNIGSKQYMAGAVTAGHFLGHFVEKTPWAHLDIAGTAYNVPDIPYYRPESATGVGVRLLVDLAMNWDK